MVVSILHKIYSMQRILIHKANPFVEYGPLHAEHAANRKEYRTYFLV